MDIALQRDFVPSILSPNNRLFALARQGQRRPSALVAIARAEKDPELKKAAVQKLSIMHSKEGTEYLMELLQK